MNEFGTFGMTLSFFNIGQYINVRRSPNFTGDLLVPSEDVETFKEKMLMKYWPKFKWRSNTFRELLEEIIVNVNFVTNEFNKLFGRNIFKSDQDPPSQTSS